MLLIENILLKMLLYYSIYIKKNRKKVRIKINLGNKKVSYTIK